MFKRPPPVDPNAPLTNTILVSSSGSVISLTPATISPSGSVTSNSSLNSPDSKKSAKKSLVKGQGSLDALHKKLGPEFMKEMAEAEAADSLIDPKKP